MFTMNSPELKEKETQIIEELRLIPDAYERLGTSSNIVKKFQN